MKFFIPHMRNVTFISSLSSNQVKRGFSANETERQKIATGTRIFTKKDSARMMRIQAAFYGRH